VVAALTVPGIIPSSITNTISITVILFFMALLSSFPEFMVFIHPYYRNIRLCTIPLHKKEPITAGDESLMAQSEPPA
jgi:hypothetical protein